MKNPLKIVLVGAGSRSFAPGVIHDLVLETELGGRFDVELALVDLDPMGGGLDLLLGAESTPGWRWPRPVCWACARR